jgi:GNAT superfamily N-acetyltransferase
MMERSDHVSTTYRPGTLADSRAVEDVRIRSLADLTRRSNPDSPWADPAFVLRQLQHYRPLHEHLALTAEQFWVAERDGRVIGYAIATLRDGIRELTDFFVAPDCQSAGIGRALLARTFPANGARRRVILATRDLRAQACYLRSGVYPRFSFTAFTRRPEPVSVATDLTVQPIAASPEALAALAAIDKALLDIQRDEDHLFLLNDRQGYLYSRGASIVGYGYTGQTSGPFALLDASDIPAVLAHAESEAARNGVDQCYLAVPLINNTAVTYLLSRRYQLNDQYFLFMSDQPFGRFENYIQFSPEMFF